MVNFFIYHKFYHPMLVSLFHTLRCNIFYIQYGHMSYPSPFYISLLIFSLYLISPIYIFIFISYFTYLYSFPFTQDKYYARTPLFTHHLTTKTIQRKNIEHHFPFQIQLTFPSHFSPSSPLSSQSPPPPFNSILSSYSPSFA